MEALVHQAGISHEAALEMVKKAVERGLESGWRVNAAVVDSSGNLVAFLRTSSSFLHSIDIAIDKAYTAASFNMPTADLFNLIKESPALRDGLLQRPRLIAFAGGFPIRIEGKLLGGIGVSGATEEGDCVCAHAGLSMIDSV